MKKFNFFTILLLLPSLCLAAPNMPQPEYSAKEMKIIQYFDSGNYENEVKAAIAEAKNFIENQVQQNKSGEKLAMVMDIDETVLSNFNNLKRLHFTQNREAWAAAYTQANDPAIKPSLELYKFARAHGVEVFFISGRPSMPEVYASTEKNLSKAGYENWKSITLRPVTDDNPSVVAYKSNARKAIADKGYKIILNIGDQYSDLAGGYSVKSIKLPNPIYALS